MFEKTMLHRNVHKGSIMECVIGYIKILCAGTAARA